MEQMEIVKLDTKEKMPYELLYAADESRDAVDDYVNRGECYVAMVNGEIIGEYVLLSTRPFTAEIVNIAVAEAYQSKGIATKLIEHAISQVRARQYKMIEVGTGNPGLGQLALYQKCGFQICGVDVDFFKKYYPHTTFENGIECRHMIRLRKDLN